MTTSKLLTPERLAEIREFHENRRPSDVAVLLDHIAAQAEQVSSLKLSRDRMIELGNEVVELTVERDRLAEQVRELSSCPNESWECAKEIKKLTAERDAWKESEREGWLKAKDTLGRLLELQYAKDRLRNALSEVRAFGVAAHQAGTSESHSFNLGKAIGVAHKALAEDDKLANRPERTTKLEE